MIKRLNMKPGDNDKTFFIDLLGFKELEQIFGRYEPHAMLGWKPFEKANVDVDKDYLGAYYGTHGEIRKSKSVWYLYYRRSSTNRHEVFVLGSVKTVPNSKYILLGNKKLVVR